MNRLWSCCKNYVSAILLASGFWWAFWYSASTLQDRPRADENTLLRVRLPIPVQLLYAGGDPFLAANLNVFRSLMVDPSITERETYRIQGRLQQDAAQFNPRHEDNYYIAAAILPWNGYVNEAQYILRRAAETRTWDWMPPFFYAFGLWYFQQSMLEAGHWAEVAASRSGEVNARALRAMAAKWYERSSDSRIAKNLIQAMQQQTSDISLKKQLQWRLERLEGLIQLQDAYDAYLKQHASPPSSLDSLVGYAGLQQLPKDPAGLGFQLDSKGAPMLRLPSEKDTDETR